MKTWPHQVLLGLCLGAGATYAQTSDTATLQLPVVPVWAQTPAQNAALPKSDAYGLWSSGADVRMTSPGASILLSRDGYPGAYVQGTWEGLPMITPDLGVADFSLLPQWGQSAAWAPAMSAQYQSSNAIGDILDVRSGGRDHVELRGSSLKGAGIGGRWTLPSGNNTEVLLGGGTEAWINDYRYGTVGQRRSEADWERHEVYLTHRTTYGDGRRSTGGNAYLVASDRGLPASIYDLEGIGARQQDLRWQVSQYQAFHYEDLQFRTEQVIWGQDQGYQGFWFSDTNMTQGAYLRFYTGTHWKKWQIFNEETVGINRMQGVYKPDTSVDFVTLNLVAQSPVTDYGLWTLGAKWATWGPKKSPLAPHVAWELKRPTWSSQALVRQVYRFPTMNDLFWTGLGNPALEPEQGWESQLGLQKRSAAWMMEGQVFATQLTDAIVWMPDDVGNWRPVNQSAWNRRGAKVAGQWTAMRWTLRGHVRYVQVRDDLGNAAPYVSPWLGHTSLSLVTGPYRSSLSWTGQAASPLYWMAPGSPAEGYLPAMGTFGVDVQGNWGSHWVATLRVENLLDQAIAFQDGYPMPGRHLLLRVRYQLP